MQLGAKRAVDARATLLLGRGWCKTQNAHEARPRPSFRGQKAVSHVVWTQIPSTVLPPGQMAKCENCDSVHWQRQQSSVQVREPETGVEKVKRKWLQRTQTVPKNLAAVLGPPPPVRQPQAAASQPDKDEQAAKCIGAGELPADGPESSVLTSAVLAQSQAGPVRSSEPVVRGIHGSPPEKHFGPGLIRERLGRKGKVASRTRQRTGVFASKIRENMERRMDPTKLLPQGQVSYLRYLERHGTFAGQTLLGMIAWQVGQSLDLLQADSLDGARDVLSLLLLMLEQCAQDNGDSTLVASHAASRPAFGSFPAAGQPTGVQPSILFLSGGTEMDKCGFGLCEGAGDYIGKEGRGRPKAEASPEATGLDNSATKDRACRPAAFSKAAANGCLGREKGRRGKKVKHGWQDEPYDGTALCLPPRQVPLCSRAGDAGEVRVGPRGSSSKAATQSPATHVRARGRASPVPPHRPQRQIPLPRPQPTRGSPEDVSADVKVPAAVFPLEGSVSADGATFDFCAWGRRLAEALETGPDPVCFLHEFDFSSAEGCQPGPLLRSFSVAPRFPGGFLRRLLQDRFPPFAQECSALHPLRGYGP